MKIKQFFYKYCIYFFIILTFSILSFYSGCSSTTEPEYEAKKFGIYLLEDPNITWESMQGKDLNSFKLKEWITEKMIDFYDYSTHVIYLNVDYNNLLNFTHNNGTPFVVVANGKRCYNGCFVPPKDTTLPHVILTPMDLCTDLVMLEFNPPQKKDIRINEDIKTALTGLGKLKLGLQFKIEGVAFLMNAYGKYLKSYIHTRQGTCTKLEDGNVYPSNNSSDIIKVGSRQYLTKLVIYNQSSYYSLPSVITPNDTLYRKNPSIIDCEDPYYFYSFYTTDLSLSLNLSAGAGFKFPEGFKSGVYYCYVEYYGMMGGPKLYRTWSFSDSNTPIRIWLGYQRSNTIQFEYDSSKDSTKCFTTLNENVTLP